MSTFLLQDTECCYFAGGISSSPALSCTGKTNLANFNLAGVEVNFSYHLHGADLSKLVKDMIAVFPFMPVNSAALDRETPATNFSSNFFE